MKMLKEIGFTEKVEWREFEDEKSNLSTASSKAIRKNRDQD
jgi:hypothetical protein